MAYSRSPWRSLVRALDVSGKHFIQHHAGGCEAMPEVPIGELGERPARCDAVRDYDAISKI